MKIARQKIGTCRSGNVINTFMNDDWEIIEQQVAKYSSADHFDQWSAQTLSFRADFYPQVRNMLKSLDLQNGPDLMFSSGYGRYG